MQASRASSGRRTSALLGLVATGAACLILSSACSRLVFAAPQGQQHHAASRSFAEQQLAGPRGLVPSGRGEGKPASAAAVLGGLMLTLVPVAMLRRQDARGLARRMAASGPYVSMTYSPQETFYQLVEKGEGFATMSNLKVLYSSIMGGSYVGMAGMLSLAIAGNMVGVGLASQKFVFSALFPVNLLLVLQSGAQLFTGNTATMSCAFFEKRATLRQVFRVWLVSYLGNIIGCGAMALIASYTGMLHGGTAAMAVKATLTKCSAGFGQTVVKAIMCNWLVCMAVFLATSAKDLTGKMVGIWFPISMFVAIGFEHSVANMFILPTGLLSEAPLTLADVLLKNLGPVTLGNLLAGALIVGGGFSFSQGRLGRGDRGSFRGNFSKIVDMATSP